MGKLMRKRIYLTTIAAIAVSIAGVVILNNTNNSIDPKAIEETDALAAEEQLLEERNRRKKMLESLSLPTEKEFLQIKMN
ncbi:MAG: hypothetical protein WA865_18825 [Spirulinaceae cyanobacterium]